MRRTGARVLHHDELLRPIELPPAEPMVIITMAEWRAHERFLEAFASVENAVTVGRLEGKLDAYQMVLDQVRANEVMTPGRSPELIARLERVIVACQEDLKRLQPVREATPAGADQHEGVPADQGPVPHRVRPDRESVPKGGLD